MFVSLYSNYLRGMYLNFDLTMFYTINLDFAPHISIQNTLQRYLLVDHNR